MIDFDERKVGSQKEPIPVAVDSRFGRVISPGDPVVTFTQSGRNTKVGKGVYRGVYHIETWRREHALKDYEHHRTDTFYVVEREDGSRTRLHYESSLCHADVSVSELIGHSI